MSSITVVQAASAQVATGATDNFVTVTLTNPTQSGNLLVAIGVDNQGLDASEAATPFSDNASGNTWQVAVPTNDGQYAIANRITQRFAVGITGRSGHSVTYTSTGLYKPSIAVIELAGVILLSPWDRSASNKGHSSDLNPRRTGAMQTLAPSEIAVAGMTHGGGNNETFASNNGFTIQTSKITTSGHMPIVLSTLTLDSLAMAEDAYNLTPNTATDWVGLIATYIAAPMTTVIYGA